MKWKPLQDWTEPIRRLLKSQFPVRDVGNIHIGMEQSSPHKARKVCCLPMSVCSLFILILYWHRFRPLSRIILRSELVPVLLHPYQNQSNRSQ